MRIWWLIRIYSLLLRVMPGIMVGKYLTMASNDWRIIMFIIIGQYQALPTITKITIATTTLILVAIPPPTLSRGFDSCVSCLRLRSLEVTCVLSNKLRLRCPLSFERVGSPRRDEALPLRRPQLVTVMGWSVKLVWWSWNGRHDAFVFAWSLDVYIYIYIMEMYACWIWYNCSFAWSMYRNSTMLNSHWLIHFWASPCLSNQDCQDRHQGPRWLMSRRVIVPVDHGLLETKRWTHFRVETGQPEVKRWSVPRV